jgi:hypothetical protein
MIKDLNIRYAILKLTKENTWETLQNISTGSDFLDRTPKPQETKQELTNGITTN